MPKVALVYDRVNTAYGGAEKLLLALHQLYPQAPLFTSVYDQNKAKWASVFSVKTSFLQKIPFAKKMHRYLAWLMPLAFETLDLSEYDIIISVTSAEAKGIITRADQLHVCYLLTPSRYLYSHSQEYLNSNLLYKLPLFKQLSQILLNYLKSWDQIAIHRPDFIIPISNLVKQRAQEYYGIKTEVVIYPSIIRPQQKSLSRNGEGAKSFAQSKSVAGEVKPYYLVISRLVHYKRIDLAIRACQRLNKNLVIVGSGPELSKLKKLAGPETSFAAHVSNAERETLLQNCSGLLMPGLEDFGITALEASSANIPVILHKNSGVSEILKNYHKAVLIDSEDLNELFQAINILEKDKINLDKTLPKAQQYDTTYFLDKFSSTIEGLYANY